MKTKINKKVLVAIFIYLLVVILFLCGKPVSYNGFLIGFAPVFLYLIKIPINDKYLKIFNIFLFLIMPFICFGFTELMSNNSIGAFVFYPNWLINLIFYFLLEIVFLFLFMNTSVAFISYTFVLFIISLINHYVCKFRGFGIFASDLFSVSAALGVAQSYDYRLEKGVIYLCFFLICSFILIYKTNITTKKPITMKIMSTISLIVFILILTSTPFLENISLSASFYSEHANGFYVNLFGQIELITRDIMPKGYSKVEAQDILNNVEPSKLQQDIMPQNIICIMNESLSDLTIYENFDIGFDPLKYIHSLKENTISGYAYASVYSGTTVISEYEFLSNNSSLLFGSTMSPYSTFVDEHSDSLAKQLNENGYTSSYLHPHNSFGYNRNTAFRHLGFKQLFFNDQFTEKNLSVSDYDVYKYIKDLTNQINPQFIFATTYQNHSPYLMANTWNLDIEDVNIGPFTNRYLALLKESDKAVQELIEYYKNSNEPTIILLFGDHQPWLGDSFQDKILSQTTSKDSLIVYKTPFVIWANYDIEEQENIEVSINYLSTLMLEQTGIEKTPYQHFLTSIRDDLPIITANGIIDSNGNYYKTIEELPAELYELAYKYQILEYNIIFDKENN